MSAKGAGGREVGRISIRVLPNLKGFRAKVKAEIEAVEQMTAKIKVEADTDPFRREVRAVTQGLKATIDVDANTEGVREQIQAAAQGTKTKVKAEVDVNRGALDRVLNVLNNVKSPGFGSGINASGYAAIFAGITAVAAPLFGLVTSAMLTLPGLIAAVATPIGALMLGLDGLKAAAARLAAPFEALKASMSAVVEQQFTPVFDKLGAVFPMLTRSLPTVTQGMANMARAAVDTITSSAGMAKIESTISNIGNALSKSAPGIGAFTKGLISLAQSFSEKLPNLSEWFNGAGKSFSEWVQRITADGTLSKAFDGLGGTLKTILEALGGMASEGLKFMQDPKNIEDFNNGLKSVGDSLTSIVTLSNQLNNLGDLFKNFMPTFDFESIKQDLLTPFTSADAPWRAYAESISQTFNSIKATVATAMASVAQTVSGVTSQIQGVWNGVSAAASAAWNAVVSTVAGAISSAVSTVVSGGAQILAEVGSWPGRIAGAVGNMGGILVGAGRALMDGLLAGIKSGLQAVLDFASGIAAKIAAVKGPIPKDRKELTPAGLALMEGLQKGIEDGTGPVLDKARSLAQEIATAIDEGLAGVDMTSLEERLDRTMDEIDLESKSLKVEKNALPTEDKEGRKAYQSKRDQLQAIRDQLALQEEQLGFSQKYGESEEDNAIKLGEQLSKMLDIGKGFAEANVTQLASDLGIGGGAISGLAGEGVNYLTSMLSGLLTNGMGGTTINVNSVDEAVATERSMTAKKSLSYHRR
ncbi:phage tail protein [Mycolicibacterium litorale]|uniref:phage tail protein n=1 Tax=Mycolicibacterium litorale TaxID=758802 RepID=UPI003CF4F709